MYNNLYSKLTRIKKHFTKQNIAKAKSVTAEIFIDLCESKDYIDELHCKQIVDFKNDFYEKIQYPALFGKMTVRKQDAVEKHLEMVMTSILAKISELEKYLSIENMQQ